MRTGPNWQSSQGATLVESALLMLLIGALAISAVSFFGAQVSGLTDQVADGSDGVMSTPSTTSRLALAPTLAPIQTDLVPRTALKAFPSPAHQRTSTHRPASSLPQAAESATDPERLTDTQFGREGF